MDNPIVAQLKAIDARVRADRARIDEIERLQFEAVPFPEHHAERLRVARDANGFLFALDRMENGDVTATFKRNGTTYGPYSGPQLDAAMACTLDLWPLASDEVPDGRRVLACLAPGDRLVMLDVESGDPIQGVTHNDLTIVKARALVQFYRTADAFASAGLLPAAQTTVDAFASAGPLPDGRQ